MAVCAPKVQVPGSQSTQGPFYLEVNEGNNLKFDGANSITTHVLLRTSSGLALPPLRDKAFAHSPIGRSKIFFLSLFQNLDLLLDSSSGLRF